MRGKMNTRTIPFIAGDGIGPEIMQAAKSVVDAAVDRTFNGKRGLILKEVPAGESAYRSIGNHLPDTTIDAIREHKVAIKGPLMTPIGDGFRSLNVTLRQALDLYVCQRPVLWFEGLPSPHRTPEGIDVVIFRENTEDLYAGIEYKTGTPEHLQFMQAYQSACKEEYTRLPSPAECGIGIKPISKTNSQRLVRAAIRWALDHNRKRVTLVHKGNIMKFTEGAFMDWGYDEAEQRFPTSVFTRRAYQKIVSDKGKEAADIEKQNALSTGKLWVDDVIADVVFEQLITFPQQFDVIATTNLNGDYISDAAAALAGGVGISPGANINYSNGIALFEANHGSAQQIAGLNKANPSSLILSAVMMLEFIGWGEAAAKLRDGLRETIKNKLVTFDLAAQIPDATTLSTRDFAQNIISAIEAED
jgi:isocitrate dehydrogenase